MSLLLKQMQVPLALAVEILLPVISFFFTLSLIFIQVTWRLADKVLQYGLACDQQICVMAWYSLTHFLFDSTTKMAVYLDNSKQPHKYGQ